MTTSMYYQFAKDFFTTHGCIITEEGNQSMHVKLTNDMDEALMNRPFYWHYMKKMDRVGEAMSLTFTDGIMEEDSGIHLHAGTPKLHQMYQLAIERSYSTRLYEYLPSLTVNKALHPWLILNIKVTYRGKQTRDEVLSIGLNLINGALITKMMDKIWEFDFRSTVSDFSFPMTPIVRTESGYHRIIRYVNERLDSLDDQWEVQSLHQLKDEKDLLHRFFTSDDVDEEYYEKELEQIDVRYKPRISIQIANGGLFYLSQETSQQLFLQ
ncbi:YqhG family protein [Halobacillus shinanisalinarum]|uniref:YqhG family protein n=1 Tax=Halobacillus shinanisalinarum TaxID=2932258 RepID=A0ABY4H0M6_9BACI|nr:YqhG family protein [Halobacillus shinanisalinarum]UOQ93720.1 YqhG family protein [Halobacillus shinanisalinarum]